MRLRVQGLTVRTTGGADAVGAASAASPAAAGASVAVTDLCSTALGKRVIDHATSLGRRVVADEFDVTDHPAVERFVDSAAESLGGIYGYVSSAVYSDRE